MGLNSGLFIATHFPIDNNYNQKFLGRLFLHSNVFGAMGSHSVLIAPYFLICCEVRDINS